MNKGPSITIDLLLVIVVLWLVTRGQGKSWIDTLFHYHPVSLNLNPLHDLSISTPFGPFTPFGGGSGASGGGGDTTGAIASASSHGPGTNTASYTVNLAGGGQMTVNASSANAALENVVAQGGVPA